MPENQKIIVTISRQMASGGAYIGHLVAMALGYKYVEREVLYKAAEELDVDIAEIRFEEQNSGFLQTLMKSFFFGTPEMAYVPPSRRPIYEPVLFEVESRIIKTFADQYDSVIIGRGGYSVLRDRPGVINVFIHAPMDFRIDRLRSFHDLTREQAREELEASDTQRMKFLKKMTGTEQYDARNFHVCIDAEAAGFETAQKMIIKMVKRRKEELGL